MTSPAAQIGSCRSEHAAFAKVWIISVYILGILSIYDPKQHAGLKDLRSIRLWPLAFDQNKVSCAVDNSFRFTSK